MDGKISLGVLCACAGLAACGGGGGVVVPIVPTIGALDSALPFGSTNGVAVNMLAADLDGVSNDQATITFNADQSFSILLPGAAVPVTVSNAVLVDPPMPNPDLRTTSATYQVGDIDVDVHLGEDGLGNDLFILARVDDPFAPAPSPLAFVVFGDETSVLPGGSAVAYTGGFVSDVFDASGAPMSQIQGDTAITANFDANLVGMTFTQTGEATVVIFTGTNIPITGAQYRGNITSTGGGTAYAGEVMGAFYGPGAEATAGTFHAVDDTGGVGNEIEIVGGFTGFQ